MCSKLNKFILNKNKVLKLILQLKIQWNEENMLELPQRFLNTFRNICGESRNPL